VCVYVIQLADFYGRSMQRQTENDNEIKWICDVYLWIHADLAIFFWLWHDAFLEICLKLMEGGKENKIER
jgi:hypothetical protein